MPRDELANLALRRSIFFPSAEIYANAPAGFWEFGPIGEKIRRKVIDFWRKEFVEAEGFLEIYGAQILPEAVFKASGHLESFNDPIVQCSKCNSQHRADELIEIATKQKVPELTKGAEMDKIIADKKIGCPKCKGKLGEVRRFNMMMKLDIGATGNQPCYLRPETCQSIFLDFNRLIKTSRVNLPVGISQAGVSFRNEIAPRNLLLREREIGQMETEIFFNPDKINDFSQFDAVANYQLNLKLLKNDKALKISCKEAVDKKIVSGKLIAYYLAKVQQLYEAYGIPNEKMRFRELEADARAFYAKETWDFEAETDLGWIELIACNYRTDYDLKGHMKESKKDLTISEDGKSFVPHIFEISIGLDRTLYVLLDLAFRKEKRGPEERTYLHLNPSIAPYHVAIFPLMKKDGLAEKAEGIFEDLRSYGLDCLYDETASIGKRYARVDEIGVPFAVTVDYDTLKDDTVTLRERTSMQQKRIKIEDLHRLLWDLISAKKTF